MIRLNAIECMAASRIFLALSNLEHMNGSNFLAEAMAELEVDVLVEVENNPEMIASRIFSAYRAELDVSHQEWKEAWEQAMEAHVRQIWLMARNGQATYEDAFKAVIKLLTADGTFSEGVEEDASRNVV